MSKPVKNFILLVDSHRRASRKRNTAGRYRVGAKTPDEAVQLLRAAIGFGSIRVYYECKPGKQTGGAPLVGYKEVVQEVSDGTHFRHVPPHHATAPRSTYER